mmetsp:Transcript_7017/g.22223  ORF Transcript_7017/g.22223 Transcript_7017/m.22223 type:complete len:257 (+) Transcript_7017:787-1557(+)
MKKRAPSGTSKPAMRAMLSALCATSFELRPPSFQRAACSLAFSAPRSTTPPRACSFAIIGSYVLPTSTTELSDEQEAARSSVLLSAILSAASSRSALSSTVTTALPAPTPSAGVPLEYAALTIAPPPVASTRSACCMRSLVLATDGLSMPMTRSAGAPIRSSAPRISSTMSALVFCARGCGAMMMELRPLTAAMDLMTGVASGLVEGDSAPITPTGLAILTTPRSGSSSITPTDLSSMMSISAARVLRKILRYLPS